MPPFGNECQFEDFDACVSAIMGGGEDEEAARAICGALQRDTKERCTRKAIEKNLAPDESLSELALEWDGEEVTAVVRYPSALDLAHLCSEPRRFSSKGEPL